MTCVYLKFLIYILIGNSCAVSENIHSQPMKKKKPFCFKGKCDSNLEKFPEGQGLKPKKEKKTFLGRGMEQHNAAAWQYEKSRSF